MKNDPSHLRISRFFFNPAGLGATIRLNADPGGPIPPMDPRDQLAPDLLESLSRAFIEQLLACLDECARGRHGLFGEVIGDENDESAWPEAVRLRELAIAIQSVFSQNEHRHALADEFLDLCSMHGESNPGERRLARMFLERIERGEVGQPTEKSPW
jgi:hypothetical protein